ncbi:DUF350 domain-containing protein [Cognatishimia sp. F0-27]|uniref:DUF350 domain-containing protein n=1 Tax=Cognatishimia sp. F0-27 TaxID=2816855 RepID=UPI001D0C27D1|nr:DUF350 domain-containing protein [Cognatishimia sp. F0-27]MCC1493231.1 DUF350 domain-containing protein [Cognatishimia sp. F0-27]
MDAYITIQLSELISTVIYTFIGVALMGASYWIIDRFTHFSVVKEIEEKQNIALAILIGAVFIALALIIGAVIRS